MGVPNFPLSWRRTVLSRPSTRGGCHLWSRSARRCAGSRTPSPHGAALLLGRRGRCLGHCLRVEDGDDVAQALVIAFIRPTSFCSNSISRFRPASFSSPPVAPFVPRRAFSAARNSASLDTVITPVSVVAGRDEHTRSNKRRPRGWVQLFADIDCSRRPLLGKPQTFISNRGTLLVFRALFAARCKLLFSGA